MELAHASVEDDYAPEENLCVEGEPGNEVFILLTGEVNVLVGDDGQERVIASEKAGGFIGEMAVLDPAPRSATVVAGARGVRVLRLDGSAFREALNTDSAIASGVIRNWHKECAVGRVGFKVKSKDRAEEKLGGHVNRMRVGCQHRSES